MRSKKSSMYRREVEAFNTWYIGKDTHMKKTHGSLDLISPMQMKLLKTSTGKTLKHFNFASSMWNLACLRTGKQIMAVPFTSAMITCPNDDKLQRCRPMGRSINNHSKWIGVSTT